MVAQRVEAEKTTSHFNVQTMAEFEFSHLVDRLPVKGGM
jgi:hypothetical protein